MGTGRLRYHQEISSVKLDLCISFLSVVTATFEPKGNLQRSSLNFVCLPGRRQRAIAATSPSATAGLMALTSSWACQPPQARYCPASAWAAGASDTGAIQRSCRAECATLVLPGLRRRDVEAQLTHRFGRCRIAEQAARRTIASCAINVVQPPAPALQHRSQESQLILHAPTADNMNAL